MKQQNTIKNRKELKSRFEAVFGEKIGDLSTDLQEILIDDLTTAFENRLNVLNRVNTRTDY